MTITVSEKSRSHRNRLMAAGAAAVLVAGGAYYIGRVYPPHGMMTAGTIAPGGTLPRQPGSGW